MAVFELVGRGSCGERQKLIAETDAEYRLAGAHRGLNMPYRRNALSRISGAVGEKKGIIFIGGEVVIPRHADEGHFRPCPPPGGGGGGGRRRFFFSPLSGD